MARLLWEVATRSFRRQAAYRAAAASGVFVNTVFGYVRASVLLYLAQQQAGNVGGMTVDELVTFAFASQSIIPVVGVFSNPELANRIRSGDIEVDLYRPVDLQAWELANWVGRAGFAVTARAVPPVLLGSVAFAVVWPTSVEVWFGFGLAMLLALVIGFALRFCTNLVAFWLLDNRGIDQAVTLTIMFFGGVLVPVNLFPAGLEAVARFLPFAAMIQMPIEVFLGRSTGWDLLGVLGFQLGWAIALLALGRVMLGSATRRLVVQGG